MLQKYYGAIFFSIYIIHSNPPLYKLHNLFAFLLNQSIYWRFYEISNKLFILRL